MFNALFLPFKKGSYSLPPSLIKIIQHKYHCPIIGYWAHSDSASKVLMVTYTPASFTRQSANWERPLLTKVISWLRKMAVFLLTKLSSKASSSSKGKNISISAGSSFWWKEGKYQLAELQGLNSLPRASVMFRLQYIHVRFNSDNHRSL